MMWGSAVRSSKHVLRCAFIFGIILLLASGIAGTASAAHAAGAYGSSQGTAHLITSGCSSAVVPTSQSLLVVLLDRSGSLTEGTNPTDPNGYSTSVTNALADLWPGSMACSEEPFANVCASGRASVKSGMREPLFRPFEGSV